ncbi:hypothetical protein AVEN_51580-1 [Araneus ventricosus]|uniref:Uncharacterized protein n=1 Tax=Araneus ventricosus TaxID=182803 RepID=A0A4Y2V3A9_ARAVE|nr:hypothetical protein AVEN_51580-1 [Araneus ventricosus]
MKEEWTGIILLAGNGTTLHVVRTFNATHRMQITDDTVAKFIKKFKRSGSVTDASTRHVARTFNAAHKTQFNDGTVEKLIKKFKRTGSVAEASTRHVGRTFNEAHRTQITHDTVAKLSRISKGQVPSQMQAPVL